MPQGEGRGRRVDHQKRGRVGELGDEPGPGRDDRRAGRHRLEQGQRTALVVGRVDEAGGAAEPGPHALGRHEPHEIDMAVDAEPPGAGAERRLERSFADQNEPARDIAPTAAKASSSRARPFR